MTEIRVYGLPELLEPESIRGEIAVVIDVLRATTTVITAIAAGLARVIPVLEVEEAKKLKKQLLQNQNLKQSGSSDSDWPDSKVSQIDSFQSGLSQSNCPEFDDSGLNVSESDLLLGGERGGKRIDGFDLGNSPREYTKERVGGKTLIFSTTNGTRAMYRARFAKHVYLASFLNAQTVVDQLLTHCRSQDDLLPHSQPDFVDDSFANSSTKLPIKSSIKWSVNSSIPSQKRIHIICAGTNGSLTEEDLLLAGLLVERLQREGGQVVKEQGPSQVESQQGLQRFAMNVQAITALEMWTRLLETSRIAGQEQPNPSITSKSLAEELRQSVGGRPLRAIGLDPDIVFAAQMDSIPRLIRFDTATGMIDPD
ncbi:MAG: 2-phosphosulfolactate phosphatase [Thermoguttaceae bacterium]